MSNPVNVTAFVDENSSNSSLLRNQDELAGTLLPVATPVAGDTQNTIPGVSAAPINTFDYETAILAESSAVAMNDGVDTSEEAFSIPPRNHMAAIADDSRSTIKRAQHAGLIAAEDEVDAVRRANQNAYAKAYNSKQAIRAANQHARARVAQEMNDVYLGTLNLQGQPSRSGTGEYAPLLRDSTSSNREKVVENGPAKSTTDAPNKSSSQQSGYQVGSYEVKEYEIGSSYASQEYEIQEYNSVYD